MKPLKPTSIKFTEPQKSFLKRKAREQKHRKVSIVVKQLVDSAMEQSFLLPSGTSTVASTEKGAA